MSRKHFNTLALGLLRSKPTAGDEKNGGSSISYLIRKVQWMACVNAIADVCQDENERFDRERFLKACGLD